MEAQFFQGYPDPHPVLIFLMKYLQILCFFPDRCLNIYRYDFSVILKHKINPCRCLGRPEIQLLHVGIQRQLCQYQLLRKNPMQPVKNICIILGILCCDSGNTSQQTMIQIIQLKGLRIQILRKR